MGKHNPTPSQGWKMPSYVGLKFDSVDLMADDEDPGHFLREHTGGVTLPDEDGNLDEAIQIGSFRAFYVDVEGAINESMPAFDVFDTRTETVGFYDLYEESLCFRAPVLKAARAEMLFEPNLLILDRLEISSQHRGRGYGLEALKGLIHWLQPGAGIVAMKPFPLQFESAHRDGRTPDSLGLKQYKATFSSARSKLRLHYAKLDFKLVPKTDFMVRRVDQQLPRPGSR